MEESELVNGHTHGLSHVASLLQLGRDVLISQGWCTSWHLKNENSSSSESTWSFRLGIIQRLVISLCEIKCINIMRSLRIGLYTLLQTGKK